MELSVKQSFPNRKSIPFLLFRELANRLAEPFPLSNHSRELTVAQSLLQNLPEGAWSVLPFLLPVTPRIWWRMLMLLGSCLANTHFQPTLCLPTHTPIVQRFRGSSDAQSPTLLSWDPVGLRQTTIQLALDYMLLMLWEIAFIKLCSHKKLLTFIEVHFNKQHHKIHHNVYCQDSLRGLFITLNSNFLWGFTEKSPRCQHQE